MVTVAVAGGTGEVGRTFLDAIVKRGSHKAFVLSRKASGTPPVDGVQLLGVDYSDIEALKNVLEEHRIEVVISALILDSDKAAESQTNLIRAAAQSVCVTKFIPSEYYLDFNAYVEGPELQFKKRQLEAVRELERHPELTWTLIRNGLFLDYLALPYKPKPTLLEPWWIFIDLDHEVCVFPEDGTQTIIFTHTLDLAAYVARLIALPAEQWPRESLAVSSKIQVKELAQIAKKVTGRDFKVTYDSVEAIRKGQISQLPSNKSAFNDPKMGELFQMVEKETMLVLLSHGYELPGKNLAELFPDVETTNIEDFLREAWKLKEKSSS